MNKQLGRENDSVEVMPGVVKSEVALREEVIQQFWLDHDIFNKSLLHPAGASPKGNFIFYDGPPFATGLPHYGHILTSTIKDAVPRFWTMNGYHVPRKWGWDCHGLPLENLIEKKLGLATKHDIEAYGVKHFNEAARDIVMEYADDWARIISRMGRWVDMVDDYKTMDSSYTESVWWVFKELDKKGLVFESFKSMHLCPRCGTILSNFEVNQGYKDIKDIAVTVQLPLLDEAGNITDTSLLVWTTTPWTLPGNMAAAVHNEHTYVRVKINTSEKTATSNLDKNISPRSNIDIKEEFLILAKGRLVQLGDVPYEVVKEMKGSDLVGQSYQPPFDYWQKQDFENKSNAWKIYHADYVELGEDGTGAVHIAPAYGEDDINLAKAHDIPIVHHVDKTGHFLPLVDGFDCQLVKPKDDDEASITHLDADIEILKRLQETGILFKKENITHSYPHCWRCDTPLLNYATTSWFVNVPKIKDSLVTQNNQIYWIPEHIGRARFGNWLEGARDWAVSRQRYWGAPIPIWRNPLTKEYKVIGSLAELQSYVPTSGNSYLLMRHGECTSNVTGVISSNQASKDSLTEVGKTQVTEAITTLATDIDIIIHSGFTRTRETANIIAAARPNVVVIEDDRIRELYLSDDLEGKTWDTYHANFPTWVDRYTKDLIGSENYRDVQKRTGNFLFDIEKQYQGKKILIVSHAGTLFALECAAQGLDIEQSQQFSEQKGDYFRNAHVEEMDFIPYPHNDNYELDYHRPYIDEIDLFDADGTKLVRVPDVFDCWFESGSMPYGQCHYPFENQTLFQSEKFPAQFIAEGLDQTRGWFYSLIVLGTALFGKSPYKNVIVNGTVLAEDGFKMSKKLQNYPDPMDLVDRVGADAMRLYLMTSPVIRGEDLNFSEKEILDLQRKNLGRLHNVLAMYDMFRDGTKTNADSTNILDRWIVSRLNELISQSTEGYKAYELDKANRPIIDFIDDVSVWYLRRSRDRFKGDNMAEKALALGTLRYVLRELAKVMAPAMPFYAEYLWLAIRDEDEVESVHLTAWPDTNEIDDVVLAEMTVTREVVSSALEERTKSNIKVRQPLKTLKINYPINDSTKTYIALIKDEVNVKEVIYDPSITRMTALDLTITPDLKAEGDAREFIRGVQERRKAAGLAPQDRITLTIDASQSGRALTTQFSSEIKKVVGAVEIVFAPNEGVTIMAGEHAMVVTLVTK